MAITTMAVALKIIANTQGVNSEVKKLAGGLGSVAIAAKAAQMSFVAFKNISGYMVSATKDAASFQKELTKIALTADNSIKSVGNMRDSIHDNSQKTGVNARDLTAGYQSLAAGGFDTAQSSQIMDAVGKAMAVSTANSGQLTDAVQVAALNFGMDASKDSADILDKMHKAGKLGNAELEDLSMILARVGGSAKMAGMGFEEALAFAETMASSKENSEIVATMSNAVLRMFNDENLRDKITRISGAQFFNKDESRRSATDVIGDIQKYYQELKSDKQRSRFFETAFEGADDRTVRGLRNILGQDESIDKMRDMWEQINNASGTIEQDFEEIQKLLDTSVNRIGAFFTRTKDSTGDIIGNTIAKPMQNIADSLEGKDAGKLVIGGTVAMGIAAAVAAAIGIKGAKNVLNFGKNAAAGEMAEKVMGAQKVFVVNWQDMPGNIGEGAGGLAKTASGRIKDIIARRATEAVVPTVATTTATGMGAGSALALGGFAASVLAVLGTAISAAVIGVTDKQTTKDFMRSRYKSDADFMKEFQVKVENNINVDKSGKVDVKTQTQRTQNYAY